MRSLHLRRETLGTRLLLIVIGSRIPGNPRRLGGKKKTGDVLTAAHLNKSLNVLTLARVELLIYL